MFLYTSVQEGLVLLTASDEDYADYAGLLFGAAAERGKAGPGDEGGT